MSEAARIADQLRRAFNGKAWHGDSVFPILNGVTAARPIKCGHTVWELVLHIAAWDGVVLRSRIRGFTRGFRASRKRTTPSTTCCSAVVQHELYDAGQVALLKWKTEHERDAALGAFGALAMIEKRSGWRDLYLYPEEENAYTLVSPVEYWMPVEHLSE